MRVISNISYSDIGHPAQMLDLWLPENKEFSIFIFFHGGGLEHGSKEEKYIQELVNKGVAVVSANYRMYPSAVFPEFIRDAAAAVAWTYQNIQNYGKCSKFFVGGSSAGGYISQMLCFDKSYLAPYGINPANIDGFIHDAGQPTVHFNVLRERGIDSRRIIVDEAAPLYFVGKEHEYAPMLFVVSDNDMENRYEQTMLMISTLKHFGYDQNKIELKVMQGTHCSYYNWSYENGDNAFVTIINDYISRKSISGEDNKK